MSAPVWVLSVDLQTKTATFQTGMAEAARSARSAFGDIRSAAAESGEGVVKSSVNMRAAIGLVDNTIRGNHAAAMADLIREFKDSSIVMAALPFAAVVGGIAAVAGIAIEVALKIKEWREEQQKLNEEEMKFGTAASESFNTLDNKILEAGRRSDELRNDHLGALRKELELIDHASMQDLVHEIETIAKAADPVFKMLEGHWYTLGIGSAGASHALDQFKNQYDSLLAQGKDKEASDLLAGTRASAERVLEAQKAMQGSRTAGGAFGPTVDYAAQYKARAVMQAAGVSDTKKEIDAQQTLVQALNAQVTAEGKIAELKKADSANAVRQTGNEDSGRRAEAAKAAAASQLAIAQQTLAADKAMATARLDIQNAGVSQRLSSEISFAARDYALKTTANAQDIAALDKAGKDYQNQLKALQEKELEITAQHAASVSELQSKASVEAYKKDVETFEQSTREKLAATSRGDTERIAAIDAAMKESQKRALQDSDFYRGLETQRAETVKAATDQANKLRADAGKEAADNTLKMGQLAAAAATEQQALLDSGRRMTDQRRVTEALAAEAREFQIKQQAYQQESAALDATGKEYENKLKAIQDKERQLVQEHENQITAIKDQAKKVQNEQMQKGIAEMESDFARGLAHVLVGQQTFASMMNGIGSQIAEGMLQNAIKDMLTLDMTREKQAAAAARQMFVAGTKFPFPANLVMPEVLAAGAFAGVMAYASGSDGVPGVGTGDTVPAMLTPGEGVVPGGVMDGLRNMARNGNMGGSSTTHIHLQYRPQIHAIDGPSVEKMLDKHGDTFAKKFHNTVRKMNR